MIIAVLRLKRLVCSTMTVFYSSTLNKIRLNQGSRRDSRSVELQGLVAARPFCCAEPRIRGRQLTGVQVA